MPPMKKITIEDRQQRIARLDQWISNKMKEHQEAADYAKGLEEELERAKKDRENRVRLLNSHQSRHDRLLAKQASLPSPSDTPTQ
jgi:hemerythrin-like domain-containing protein